MMISRGDQMLDFRKNGRDILTVLKPEVRSNSNLFCLLVIKEQIGLLPTFGYSKRLLSFVYNCSSNENSKHDKACYL